MNSEVSSNPAERPELDPAARLILREIESMSPGEVLALWRNYGSLVDPEALTDAIEALPGHNVESAEVLFRAFVESPLAEDRYAGSLFISALTPYNHDLGISLWRRLVQDESPKVRLEATDELRELREMGQEDATEHLMKLGISADEAAALLAAAVNADNGGDIFDLGRSVIERINRHLAPTVDKPDSGASGN